MLVISYPGYDHIPKDQQVAYLPSFKAVAVFNCRVPLSANKSWRSVLTTWMDTDPQSGRSLERAKMLRIDPIDQPQKACGLSTFQLCNYWLRSPGSQWTQNGPGGLWGSWHPDLQFSGGMPVTGVVQTFGEGTFYWSPREERSVPLWSIMLHIF